MYLPNPSDYVQAIQAATGDLIWEYKRKLPEDLNKFLIVPSINRNVAIYGNMIIDTSADDFVYALDAQTGKLVWENRIVDYREDSGAGDLGPHHRQRQNYFGARLRIQGHSGWLHHYGARRQNRQGAVAHPHHSHAPASRATKPGATFLTRSAATWARGWCPASIRS